MLMWNRHPTRSVYTGALTIEPIGSACGDVHLPTLSAWKNKDADAPLSLAPSALPPSSEKHQSNAARRLLRFEAKKSVLSGLGRAQIWAPNFSNASVSCSQ